MNFLVDNRLPVALVRFFTDHGHGCKHVLDLKMEEANDHDIWRYAADNGMAVISKDEDFITFARASRIQGQLVYVRLGNCRNQALLAAFRDLLPQLILALENGERIVEIR